MCKDNGEYQILKDGPTILSKRFIILSFCYYLQVSCRIIQFNDPVFLGFIYLFNILTANQFKQDWPRSFSFGVGFCVVWAPFHLTEILAQTLDQRW